MSENGSEMYAVVVASQVLGCCEHQSRLRTLGTFQAVAGQGTGSQLRLCLSNVQWMHGVGVIGHESAQSEQSKRLPRAVVSM